LSPKRWIAAMYVSFGRGGRAPKRVFWCDFLCAS
jgi:hypothetical protein